MNQIKLSRRTRRLIRDFALGLALFVALAMSGLIELGGFMNWIAATAHAGLQPEPEGPVMQSLLATAQVGVHLQVMALFSMALAFASLFALNLWFAKHTQRLHVHCTSRHGR